MIPDIIATKHQSKSSLRELKGIHATIPQQEPLYHDPRFEEFNCSMEM